MQLAQTAIDRLRDFGQRMADVVEESEGACNPVDVMALAEDWRAIEEPYAAAAHALMTMSDVPAILGANGAPLRAAYSRADLGLLVVEADQMRARLGSMWVTVLNRAYLETAGMDGTLASLRKRARRYVMTLKEKLADREDDLRAANAENVELVTRIGELEGQLAVAQVPADV